MAGAGRPDLATFIHIKKPGAIRMFARTSSRKSQIIAASLVAVSLLNVTLFRGLHESERGWAVAGLVYPQIAVASVSDGLGRIGEWLGAVGDRAQELRDARSRIALLEQKLEIAQAQLVEKERSLETICRTLLFAQTQDSPSELKLTEARVVGRDATNWPGIAILDRGSVQGVKAGSGVISGKSVVGIVSAVRGSACVVRLVTHPLCRVAAYTPRTAESRHVTGTLTDTLRMLDLHEKPPEPGDAVLTSGEMGVFPRGLLLGRIIKADKASGSLLYDVHVRPTAALSTLHDALIIAPQQSDALDLIREQGKRQ